jgi:hypothetical protein
LTMPVAALDDDVDKLPAAAAVAEARRDSDAERASDEDDCAAAKPIRAEAMMDLEIYIFAAM